jgi:hypothetical protein
MLFNDSDLRQQLFDNHFKKVREHARTSGQRLRLASAANGACPSLLLLAWF